MGLIISRFREKPSTKELLEQIQKNVEEIEEYREHTQQRQKRLVGCLVLYSIVSYLVAALVCYFYYFPDTLQEQVLYASPFIIFPFIIYILKRLLTWYYRRKLSKNEQKLRSLRERQEKILEQVMETETYKVAKEILETYAPDQLRRNQMHKTATLPPLGQLLQTSASQHSDVRRRVVNSASTPQAATQGVLGGRPISPQNLPHQTPIFTPRPSLSSPSARPGVGVSNVRSVSSVVTPGPVALGLLSGPPTGSVTASSYAITPAPSIHTPVTRIEGGPPGPPMPRPVLPRERGYLDRFIEYLVGDGPANRFALVCRQCESHNGMALKDEFPYLAFRCAYCFYWNPARKQRPSAPRLENLAPQLPPVLPVAEVQEEEEEEQEEQESSSGEEEEEEEEEDEEEEEEEEGGVEEEESGSSSSAEEEDEEEEEGAISSEVSSTKVTSSQEGVCRLQQAGSLEDVAKSTPSSDPSMSEEHRHFGTGSSLANSSTCVMSSSTTPSSATEAEETE